jgi:hypothetical protein
VNDAPGRIDEFDSDEVVADTTVTESAPAVQVGGDQIADRRRRLAAWSIDGAARNDRHSGNVKRPRLTSRRSDLRQLIESNAGGRRDRQIVVGVFDRSVKTGHLEPNHGTIVGETKRVPNRAMVDRFARGRSAYGTYGETIAFRSTNDLLDRFDVGRSNDPFVGEIGHDFAPRLFLKAAD